jgi:hypothetical protein
MSTANSIPSIYEYNRIQIRRDLQRQVFQKDEQMSNSQPVYYYKLPVERGFAMGMGDPARQQRGTQVDPFGPRDPLNPFMVRNNQQTQRAQPTTGVMPSPLELEAPQNDVQARLFKLSPTPPQPQEGLLLTGMQADRAVDPRALAANRGVQITEPPAVRQLNTDYIQPLQELKYAWWAPANAMQQSVSDTNVYANRLITELQESSSNGVADATTSRNGSGGTNLGMSFGSNNQESQQQQQPNPQKRPFSRLF